MKKIFLLSIMISFWGCQEKVDYERLKSDLKEIDSEMSVFSQTNGMKAAFEKYIADSGVLLRPNSMPIEGKESFLKFYENLDDRNLTLTWEPLFAGISESADLGYTYGIWRLSATIENEATESSGTYVTIWKKDAEGRWKIILDTGNEGLKDESE